MSDYDVIVIGAVLARRSLRRCARRGPADIAALAVHIMGTALTGATFDIDGGEQLVA